MASYARITLIGNIGGDPQMREVSTAQGPTKVVDVNLAVNNRGIGQNAQDTTDWFRCSFWGRQAEVVSQYVKKGDPLFVEGRLSTRAYVDKEGKDRVSLEVRATEFQLLSTRGGEDNGGGYQGGQQGGYSGGQQGSQQGAQQGGYQAQASRGGGAQGGGAQRPAPAGPPMGPAADDDLPF